METIQELAERLDGLVSSISKDNIDDKEFISHKYLLISLHAYTEKSKIESSALSSRDKLASRKINLIYESIESLLSKKAHESASSEMYQKILECQKLVRNSLR